jgi:hypothetical protein
MVVGGRGLAQNFVAKGEMLSEIIFSFPNSERQTLLLHERVAARATSRIFPRLHEMFRRHRTRQFYSMPFKPSRISAFRREQTFPENHRRNFLSGERGKISCEFRAPRPAAHARENVEQLPALAADDRLHVAIQPAVRAAGNVGAKLALRTFKKKRLAHGSRISPE